MFPRATATTLPGFFPDDKRRGAPSRCVGLALAASTALCFLSGCGSLAPSRDAVQLEVAAGPYNRHNTPLRWEAPTDFELDGAWSLVRVEDSEEIPLQIERGSRTTLHWIIQKPLVSGSTRTYRLEPRAPKSFPPVQQEDLDGKHLRFSVAGKPVVTYNYGVIEPPEGVAADYARSGYMHPLWVPSGRVVSDHFPHNHRHHYGVWMPWTQAYFEGRRVDFWALGKRSRKHEEAGTVSFADFDSVTEGPVYSGFRARHEHIFEGHPEGPKTVLSETWDVRVYAISDFYLIDLDSLQQCAGPEKLELKKYHYGGFGYRGSIEWDGEDASRFLTSAGKGRLDGHGTKARWCELYGDVAGAPAGVGFLCHPENFRAPQGMRLSPNEPFFSYAACHGGDFEITPEKPLRSRYRLYLHDGNADADETESRWRDYAVPPRVTVLR